MMLSVDEINKLQEENDHWQQLYQNEHCELLQVKEEQRLFALEAKKMVAEISAKLEWYKQALQEIRTIAGSSRECILSEVSCCDICKKLDKILDLITKAEKE